MEILYGKRFSKDLDAIRHDAKVSYCPELDIASCGETVDQAKKNLNEVTLINLEEAQKLGTLNDLLQEAGLDESQGILASRKELVGFTPIEVAL